ncbi:SCO1664 family protein [Aeromicrobium sp. IC_218]|uniref:SCO1664 family protein n=1 Tax=Aeromicrobium sp. IC_218 TaxID=2545468 RepID=UPI00103C78C9|nr:SCO1664 family protein [Aeromicrobium sp. IC_218]TCI98938.1 SCO1664 family protein [Aeromicrobium sp. IC_218]
MTVPGDLLEGELVLQGRIMPASNATFLATIGDVQVVYKPVAGERPLWDFPDGTLAQREVAAYLVSEATGWDVVPPTWLRDGPHGVGMVQRWMDADPEQEAVTVVRAGELPEGWHHVMDGLDEDEEVVSVVHEESAALRRIAVLDVVINNADRKGGHVLEMPGGHRHGVDHGVSLHAEHKLRTVLWGWIGQPLTDEERAGVERVREALDDGLARTLQDYLTGAEVEALLARCDVLLDAGVFPAPSGSMPPVPWPPF